MEPNFSFTEGRLAALDDLRGVAILAVFASHVGLVFGGDFDAARALAVPALGVGVDLFFVISGFVVAEHLRRLRREAQGDFWRCALAFWGRRILRIGPPAWVVLVLIASSERIGIPLGASVADLKAAAGFYANFHWAPCFAGKAQCGALLTASHYWSLAAEMQFYLAAPILIALPYRWTATICCGVLLAGFLCERPWGGFWWTFRADGLAVGVLLSLASHRRWALPPMGAVLASFWLLAASVLIRLLGALASGAALTANAVMFGCVVASAVRTRRALDKTSAWQKLGQASFSIYLVHLPILTGVHQIFGGQGLAVVALTVSIAAILLCALLLERWVTRPAQNLGRRFSGWTCGQVPMERPAGRAAT